MIQLIALDILLIAYLVLCICMANNNFFSPQILFCAGFLLAGLYAIFYVRQMELNFSIDTLLVLFLGITIFSVVSLVMYRIFVNKAISKIQINRAQYINQLNVELWKLLLIFALELFAIIYFVFFLFSISRTTSFSRAMRFWDYTNKFTEVTIDKPTILSLLNMVTNVCVYFQLYLLAHQLANKYKSHRIIILINIMMGIINSILTGSRGGTIEYVFVFIVMLYYLYESKYYWKKKINIKILLLLFVVGIAVLFFLFFSKSFMGRASSTGLGHYICIYLSAELKNLDTFVRKGKFGTDFSHSQTFVNLRLYLNKRYGFSDFGTKLDIPFQSVKGFGLGNVYTVFYMFLYDGGYPALIILTSIMAVVIQLILYWAIKYNHTKEGINISLIIYSILLFTVFFAFFSDKFYEVLFDIGFIRRIIIMIILNLFLFKFKLFSSKSIFVLSDKRKYKVFPIYLVKEK